MILQRVGPPGAEQLVTRTPDGRLHDLGSMDPLLAASPEGRAQVEHAVRAGRPLPRSPQARVGAPVPRPGKLITVGLNYADHAAEAAMDLPEEPVYFLKDPATIVGSTDDILLPEDSTALDWEVELAVVVGRDAHRLATPAEAAAHICGYTISHDVCDRNWQLSGAPGWDRSKVTPTFNPLGPVLVTPDELGDVGALRMRTWVDGRLRQDGITADMRFSPAYLVWHLSQITTLQRGDVISTGTPAGSGLGHSAEHYLRDGDVVELEITGLGRMRQRVRTVPTGPTRPTGSDEG
ncbi:fumarylacetoacetate hydrolase family protein [Nocardioides sp. LHD-245]|uniref:fumarylacetoacetate hydrolase family protein n=1 Tax=Nocardioides sp. LHD-245 TaxID=3051387 RepID=UPI0027DEED3A|nr:fumarylacetoacetate hydrolase family protein [Nocardioides sp. LHD-245]